MICRRQPALVLPAMVQYSPQNASLREMLKLNPRSMSRKERVKIAKQWAESISTAKKIKVYRKYFGVDKLCAAKELLMAGVTLKEKYAERWATRIERKAAARKTKRRKPRSEASRPLESDNTFYFISGHTSGGFAYGITWDEAEEAGYLDEVHGSKSRAIPPD